MPADFGATGSGWDVGRAPNRRRSAGAAASSSLGATVTAEAVIYVLMGLSSVAGAVTVVVARNPVYSGMGLLGTMLSLAVIYVAQLAHFVAAIQIIVYAGAVMTLFLFVIMLIGVDKAEDTSENLPRQRLLVGAVVLVAVGLASFLGFSSGFDWVPAAGGEPVAEATNGTVEAIGESLFSTWVLAFEVTALLLTVAAAGAIALAHYRRSGAPIADAPHDTSDPAAEARP